ncbi:Serine/threonine-protein kinase tnni3k [Tulasnella sp. 403]|nr:Serine/threonine-protein kinase tnni3k [Tulasnella sp. 403]
MDPGAFRLPGSDIKFDDDPLIGSGRFGTMLRARVSRGGEVPDRVVAVKRFFAVEESKRSPLVERLEGQVTKWAALKFENIVAFVGFTAEPAPSDNVQIVYAFVPGGNLSTYLTRESPSYARRLELAMETANGLLYLHGQTPPICHGNLHPHNVLINGTGNAVLSDYGIPEMLGDSIFQDTPDNDLFFCYRAPELFIETPLYAPNSDIWSWACLFLQIITDHVPYPEISTVAELRESFEQNILPADPNRLDCPPRAQNLLGLCWKVQPENRPLISEVVTAVSGQPFRFKEIHTIEIEKFVLPYGLWIKGLMLRHFLSSRTDALRFSRDGQQLAVVVGSSIYFYETETWTKTLDIPLLDGATTLQCMNFSRSGSLLVAATSHEEEYLVLIWDLKSSSLLSKFSGHSRIIWTVDVTPDDALVISGSGDSTMRLWYPNSNGTEVNQTIEMIDEILHLAIAPEPDFVAVGLDKLGVQLWNIRTKTMVASVDGSYTRCVNWSVDGEWILWSSMLGQLRVWTFSDLKPDAENIPFRTFEARNSPVCVAAEGNVYAVNMKGPSVQSPQSIEPQIGRVPGSGIWRYVHLGPVSNDGSGLVVGRGAGNHVVIAKYASWDSAGAYQF